MVTEIERPDVVQIDSVSKRFVVRKDNSLKERLVTFGRSGRRHREDFWALKDVSITVAAGTTIGLIGHNGSGKSTLLKIIGGILDPTAGTVRNRGRIAALLELGAGFHPDLTGRENVYLNASILGLSKDQTDARFDEILAFSGIGDFIDSQVKFYSSGMYVRLAFAVAVHTDPDVLLVDEVLAVGDEAFQRKCMDKIRSFQEEGRTIILVTHALHTVVELCDRAVLLNRGQIVIDGDPVEAVAAFRDILEERRLSDLRPDEQHGSMAVTSVVATADNPDARGAVVAGEGLSIDVKIVSDRSLAGYQIGIQVDNTLGQAMWGTTNKRLGFELPDMIGTSIVRFRIPHSSFGAGKFFVNLSIMTASGVHVHDWPQATSFDGHDYGVAFGSIHMVPEIAIVKE